MPIFFVLLLLFFSGSRLLFAQNTSLLDSLHEAYHTEKQDTLRVQILSEIALRYSYKQPDTSLILANQTLKMAQDLNFQKAVASSYHVIAHSYYKKSNFPEAVKYYQKAIEVSTQIQDKQRLASSLGNLAGVYRIQGKYELSIQHHTQSLKILEAMNDRQGIAKTIQNIANVYYSIGKYDLAIEYYEKSLLIRKELNDKKHMGQCLNNIAACYYEKKDYDKSLKYHNQSLKIKEELQDEVEISFALHSIGDIYLEKRKITTALDYYNRAIKLYRRYNDKIGVAEIGIAFSQAYAILGNYNQSIREAEKALLVAEELGIPSIIKSVSAQLYKAHKKAHNYEQALMYFEITKAISDSLFSLEKSKVLSELTSTMELERKEKELTLLEKDNELTKINAEKQELSFKAEREAQKRIQYTYIGVLGVFVLILALVGIGYKQKQKANQLLMHKNIEIQQKSESLQEANAEILQQKEEIEAIAENLKEANVEIQKSYEDISIIGEMGQKITSTLDIKAIIQLVHIEVRKLMQADAFGIGLLNELHKRIDFDGFVENGEIIPLNHDPLDPAKYLSALCLIQNQTIHINHFNKEHQQFIRRDITVEVTGLENQSIIYIPLRFHDVVIGVMTVQALEEDAYTERHLTLLSTLASYISIALENAKSYDVIQDKNKHITDSIRYAETIQQAILPTQDLFNAAFAEHFIFFYPKDIVSGDFYWAYHLPEEEKTFVAVADCTGHGVPGAFMSMIGSAWLDQIVKVEREFSVENILEKLNQGIIKSLKQESGSNNDGMDISILLIEKSQVQPVLYKVSFCAAKRTVFYIEPQKSEVKSLKGDNKLIGGIQKKNRKFTKQTIEVSQQTQFYLSSDGFVDQIGKVNKKKIGTNNLLKLLEAHQNMQMETQKTTLENYFIDHKGDAEQRDDVVIVGIKLK
ncbi:MAG: tetratricopeptide repeat protein [Bernardetiaceae bacterium]|nr:tetratricopeptide repeat protein [Bernardetiaceae bacterium]